MTNPQVALMAAMQAGNWSNTEILNAAEVFLEWLNIEDEKSYKAKRTAYSQKIMNGEF
jgi:hypothetical protein